MRWSGLLVAWVAVGCGRLGFELVSEQVSSGGGAASGAGGSQPGGGAAGTGGSRDGGSGSGGMPGDGGNGGVGPGGNGGVANAGAGGSLDAGTGGTATGGASSGGAGGLSSGGADGGPCVPTNGGVEICDGRDNDCSGTIDDGGACSNRCLGLAYGGHGYMLCRNSTLSWDGCRSACQAESMDLVVVGDAGENTFLGDWVAAERAQVWYGGSDQATEGDWRWVDGTPFWSGGASGSKVGTAFAAWMTGTEPDNVSTSLDAANCLMVTWNRPYEWDDQRCTTFTDYVCETL